MERRTLASPGRPSEAWRPKDPVIDKFFCLDILLFSIILALLNGLFLEETRPEYGAVSRVTLEL